jgi:hypothetical protein
MDDHFAEHFIKDPFIFETGQALLIEMHNDGMVYPYMGMGRDFGRQAAECQNPQNEDKEMNGWSWIAVLIEWVNTPVIGHFVFS